MKVFITGATGFVGQEILKRLHESGHSTRILARHPDSAKTRECISRFGAELHSGDVLDDKSLTAGLANCDAVIHLVGIISEVGKNTFENVHTQGTRNIVSAAQQSGVTRFVHMSALGTRPNAVARYHRSKWAAEEIVRGSGLDYTIFRPSIIYGPHDAFVNLFAAMSRYSPVLPIIGSGRSKMQPVHVTDVATCFAGALTQPNSVRQTYDLCGGEILSFEEVLDTILRVTRRKRLKIHLPLALARIQVAVLEFIFPRLLRKAPPLNRDQLLMLCEDNVGNPGPANAKFGIRPVSFKEGIALYLSP
ncbi:MAG TPA: complex I NDUFA9 subunit family protein [Verrucomicrobiae bacterium]|nr:complex I NDUFA9 subunit family protein [Verrucomicrobiae bacterium]